MNIMTKSLRTLAVVLGLVMINGCVTYELCGKVVDGSVSSVILVDENDERLCQTGISKATVQLMLDPRKLSRKDAGTVETRADGTFAIPVSEPGAGLLEYDARVIARYPKMSPAIRFLPLPPSNKRVLITLAPGEDQIDPMMQRDIIRETRELGEQYMR